MAPAVHPLRLLFRLPRFLRTPCQPQTARENIAKRLETRGESFLSLAERAIYENPRSPVRPLLLGAGCSLGDLAASVRSVGLETTLEKLRDEGVILRWETVKRLLSPPPAEGGTEGADLSLANPGGGPDKGKKRTVPSQTGEAVTNWPFIEQEAEKECVLLETLGLLNAPAALWYPLHASATGLHQLLVDLKQHRPPEVWFSHDGKASLHGLALLAALRRAARRVELQAPSVVSAGVKKAAKISTWLAEAAKPTGKAVLRTTPSSAVKVAEAAGKNGLDLSGGAAFVAGENFTVDHYRSLADAGLQVLPRYVATGSGLLAVACGQGRSHDEMHVCLDSVAVVPAEVGDEGASALLFTTLQPSGPLVLLNAELGDSAMMFRRPCGCAFGRLGMNLHIASVGSIEKLTLEGTTVLLREVVEAARQALARTSEPAHPQIWRVAGDGGREQLAIAVDPKLGPIDVDATLAAFYIGLSQCGPRCRVAADVWRQARVLTVVRSAPKTAADFTTPLLLTPQPE